MYSGKSGCIREKLFFSRYSDSNRARWLYSGKSGVIRAKVVVLGQRWFYLGKKGSISAKVVVYRQSGCIPVENVVILQKKLYSIKVVVFVQK